MLIEEYTSTLTVEMVTDITQSQLTCFGNHPVKIRSNSNKSLTVTLLVNDDIVVEIHNQTKDTLSLATLIKRLNGVKDQEKIEYSVTQSNQFAIGFYTVTDGFIEIINSNEMLLINVGDK